MPYLSEEEGEERDAGIISRGCPGPSIQPMLTLVNTNRMVPPIAPLGLEYVAGDWEPVCDGHHSVLESIRAVSPRDGLSSGALPDSRLMVDQILLEGESL